MDFSLTPEQQQLRQLVRYFADGEIRPTVRALWEKEEFSYDLTKKMGELGFMGIMVSPEHGGLGLDPLSYIIVVEELARVSASQAATVAAHNTLGVGPIANWGSKQQKEKYLPDLCAGKKLWGFGLTEPESGSDAGDSRTTADLKQGKISLNSPVARALIGKYAGDVAEVQTPGGKREYEILDVRYE